MKRSPRASALLQCLFSIIALGLVAGCASVQSGQLHRTEPFVVHNCKVYGVRALFPELRSADEIPLKLGAQIANALTARGLTAIFTESTRAEIADATQGPLKVPGAIFVVEGDSVVIEHSQYINGPNGISFHKVSVFDGATGELVADYKLRVATGPFNFKTADGGFKATASDFVRDSIDATGRLMVKASR